MTVSLRWLCLGCGGRLMKGGHRGERSRCRSCHEAHLKATLGERFWSKVDRSAGADACWPFMGWRDHEGYGRYSQTRAHRLAYQLAIGPIPVGLGLRHSCDVPACCNPLHLTPGTQADNIADRDARGRTARGDRSGLRLHPEAILRGSASPVARLTDSDVADIRRRLERGETHRAIAGAFGVAKSTISAISRGQNWRVPV